MKNMKQMYRFFFVSLLITASFATADCINATNELDQIDQAPLNPKPQEIGNGIANIVTHISAIVGNPHNRPNVVQNTIGILGNIVNIALVAANRGYKTKQQIMDYLIEELHLDQELRCIAECEEEKIHADHPTITHEI